MATRREASDLSHQVVSQVFPEEPIGRRDRVSNSIKPLQRRLAQAAAHRIAHDQRANERRAPDGRAEQHAQVPAPVEAQAAADERAGRHGESVKCKT